MKVRSDGEASIRSSLACAYSNSKPTTSRPVPTAKPLMARLVGVGLTPRKAVMSASRRRGDTEQRDGQERERRSSGCGCAFPSITP